MSEQVFNEVIKKLQSKFCVDGLTKRDIFYAMEKIVEARVIAYEQWPDTSEQRSALLSQSEILVCDFESLFSAEYDVVVRVAIVTGLVIGKMNGVDSEKCVQCAVLSELVKNGHATVEVQPNGKWMFRATEAYVDLMSDEDLDESEDQEVRFKASSSEEEWWQLGNFPKWQDYSQKRK